jgi:uncharacterized protein YyaL (SSP411 family)
MTRADSRSPLAEKVATVLINFEAWLDAYGENSWDFQSYYAGPIGRFAKALYYKNKWLGTVAVTPMVFSEAFIPDARRLFHHRMRFPIADAHYAMGFAFLYQATGKAEHLKRAAHFLKALESSRCPGFEEFCWGYAFDWVTLNGVIKAGTPLITTTPYAFEAFLQAHRLEPRAEWRDILESVVRHASTDIKDHKFSETANTSSYTPTDQGGVVNASAYRATLLTSAAALFDRDELLKIAAGNVSFVLESQNTDGSWPYAKDGVRNFVDHFHTCFVMKALAKIHAITGEQRILDSLKKGVDYYLRNLIAEDGLPRPFSKAPRLTVYKRELYDCAECVNLCLLLRDRFPRLNETLHTAVAGVLANWVRRDGSFRSRKLVLGWDNVPMHRWGQSQMFRSLAFWLCEDSRCRAQMPLAASFQASAVQL